jgi:hypothetical protein
MQQTNNIPSDHGRHGRVDVKRLEFVTEMRFPQCGEISIGHVRLLLNDFLE